MPLVLATSVLRSSIDIDTATAESILDGRLRNWSAVGEPAAPLRLVTGGTAAPAATGARRAPSDVAAVTAAARSLSVIAVVPATALRPGVRAIRVGGHHPLLDPVAYPLRTPGDPPERVGVLFGGGDLMLARRVGDQIRASGDPASPLRFVRRRIAGADLAFATLECTLARLGPPTQGDAFAGPASGAGGLRRAGFDVLSLANNHTGDFGPRSLLETIGLVRKNGMHVVGAGSNDREARKPVIADAGGISIGFLAFNAIGETPAAAIDTPGAVRIHMQPRLGPLRRADLNAFAARVQALARQVDVVIVMPHWGAQYTHGIHSDQRVVARSLVRAGADAVIGSHSHWVGGIEVYRGAPIVYSLGNFVFDMDLFPETTQAIAVELMVWDGRIVGLEVLPVRIGDDWAPRFAEGAVAREILADVAGASAIR